MAAKLTEVATQRFVDNITSITPGALKGGLAAVARHPQRDELVIGGSDGEPKLYRMIRQTVRVIGNDLNLIREFPALPGRVYSVAISSDGKRIAAGSSLDGRAKSASTATSSTPLPGQNQGDQPEGRHIPVGRRGSGARKVPQGRRQADRESRCRKGESTPSHFARTERFRRGGSDGMVRYQSRDRKPVKEFAPVTVKTTSVVQNSSASTVAPKQEEAVEKEEFPGGSSLASLEV